MRHGRRMVTVVTAALLVLALGASPAAAAKPGTESFSFSQAGVSADAFVSECVDNADGTVTCFGAGGFVFAGKMHERGQGASRGAQVCYNEFTDTFNPMTGEGVNFQFESGCATDLPDGAVVADDLTSIIINPTTIVLTGESCTVSGEEFECIPMPEREVEVAGTFTGTGTIVRQSFRSFTDDGVCVFRDSSSGFSRTASFSGSVDGEAVELDETFMQDGRFSFSSTCTIG